MNPTNPPRSTVERTTLRDKSAVDGMSGKDPAIIVATGCTPIALADSAPAEVQKVARVGFTLGKAEKQSVLQWPETPGADHFEVQVNLDPTNPGAPFTSLGTVSRRSKLVTTPTRGGQFLARVAAVASDGTRADWSDVILATAR